MTGKRGTTPRQPGDFTTEEDRFAYVVESADTVIGFYQGEVNKYSRWYMLLTAVTLIGTALTPLLVLLLDYGQGRSKFWIALPSGVAGLAAAFNSAFHLRDEWGRSYFALSAIDNERDRFLARASPEYSVDKTLSQIIDNFQNRISGFVMSEVTQWQKGNSQTTKHGRQKG